MLDDEVDLLNRREDRIDRNLAERVGLLMLGRSVAAVAGDPEIHVEDRIGAGQRRDDLIRVDDLDLGRPGHIASGHHPLSGAVGTHIQVRAGLAVELGRPA